MNSLARPYLCGGINGCTDSEANDWREDVIKVFPLSINPMIRDYRGREDECYREIVEGDIVDIESCHVLLVNYTKPSVGSAMEVYMAYHMGKRVILWCDESATLSPWLRYHSHDIVHSLEDAVGKVEAWAQ